MHVHVFCLSPVLLPLLPLLLLLMLPLNILLLLLSVLLLLWLLADSIVLLLLSLPGAVCKPIRASAVPTAPIRVSMPSEAS
jgi:hypothetical protein